MADRNTYVELRAKLREGLQHHASYRPIVSDDEPIYTAPGDGNCLNEFAHHNGRLQLGDLHDCLAALNDLLGDR